MTLSSDQLNELIYQVADDIRHKAIESTTDPKQQHYNFKVAVIEIASIMLEEWSTI